MNTCHCDSDEGGFEIIDLKQMDLLAGRVATDPSHTVKKIVLLEGRQGIAAGTENGERGCITIPVFGFPVGLCWEFVRFDIDLPRFDVEVAFTVSLGDQKVIKKNVRFTCEDITHPSSCTTTIEGDRNAAQPELGGCNWNCMKKCAPGCISCGTNKWCWAICAGKCLVRCCL